MIMRLSLSIILGISSALANTGLSTRVTVPEPSRFSGFERILLTAQGTLQRVVSAFCDADVTVEVLSNQLMEKSLTCDRYSREVSISVGGEEFCVARSTVTLPLTLTAVTRNGFGEGELGIAQVCQWLLL